MSVKVGDHLPMESWGGNNIQDNSLTHAAIREQAEHITLAADAVDAGNQASVTLESIAIAVESSGKCDELSVNLLNIAIDDMRKRLGLPDRCHVSVESASTPEATLNVAMESIGDMVRNVWDALIAAIVMVFEKIVGFFKTIFNWIFGEGGSDDRGSGGGSYAPGPIEMSDEEAKKFMDDAMFQLFGGQKPEKVINETEASMKDAVKNAGKVNDFYKDLESDTKKARTKEDFSKLAEDLKKAREEIFSSVEKDFGDKTVGKHKFVFKESAGNGQVIDVEPIETQEVPVAVQLAKTGAEVNDLIKKNGELLDSMSSNINQMNKHVEDQIKTAKAVNKILSGLDDATITENRHNLHEIRSDFAAVSSASSKLAVNVAKGAAEVAVASKKLAEKTAAAATVAAPAVGNVVLGISNVRGKDCNLFKYILLAKRDSGEYLAMQLNMRSLVIARPVTIELTAKNKDAVIEYRPFTDMVELGESLEVVVAMAEKHGFDSDVAASNYKKAPPAELYYVTFKDILTKEEFVWGYTPDNGSQTNPRWVDISKEKDYQKVKINYTHNIGEPKGKNGMPKWTPA